MGKRGKASSGSSGKNTNHGKPASTTALPLVWVQVGKTQHAAFLVQEEKGHDDNECLIQWTSTMLLESVPASSVERNLTPRKRRQSTFDATMTTRTTTDIYHDGKEEEDEEEEEEEWEDSKPSSAKKPLARVSMDTTPPNQNYGCEDEFDAKNVSFHSRPKSKAAIQSSPTVEPSQSSSNRLEDPRTQENVMVGLNNNDNYDGDDDEVEVLWTLPPSPPRQPPNNDPEIKHNTNSSSEENTKPAAADRRKQQQKKAKKSFHSFFQPQTFKTTKQNQQPLRSSAGETYTNPLAADRKPTLEHLQQARSERPEGQLGRNRKELQDVTAIGECPETDPWGKAGTETMPPAEDQVQQDSVAKTGQWGLLEVEESYDDNDDDGAAKAIEQELAEIVTPLIPETEPVIQKREQRWRQQQKQQQSSSFRLVQSAYVQTLAEISHTILQDARWRVNNGDKGRGGSPLFGWELGDDMTAVLALKQLYIPTNTVRRQPRPCICLLCCKTKDTPAILSTTSDKNPALRANDDLEMRDPNNIQASDDVGVEKDGNGEGDMAENKYHGWIYLYCRLFYRRGPWFRIDDIYERYYKPKSVYQSESDGDDDQECPPTGDRHLASKKQGPLSSNKIAFQQDLLSEFLSCAEDMFRDLQRLVSYGLMRSFDGEQECGTVVGQSVITQDMRAMLLSKLGVKQQRNGTKNKNSNDNGGSSKNNKQGQQRKENQLWKHMNRQQSIVASIQNNNHSFAGKSQRLLPVIKHVNAILLEKLALDILRSCCGLPTTGTAAGYVPSVIRKVHENGIRQRLNEIIKSLGLLCSNASSKNFACWKIREGPSRCLRRCCRLYLCASGGPGDMRSDSDGSNGWKSIMDSPGDQVKIPLYNRCRPPGVHSWSQVSYPGSMVRFGLSSALFQRAYRPIDPESDIASSNCRVFLTHALFRAWELCAELRAHVDYWIELYELMRFENRQQERRRDSEGNSIRCGGDTEGFDSVDFLKLLTTEGLDSMVRTFLATFTLGHEKSLSIMASIRASIQKDLGELPTAPGDLTEPESILFTLAIASVHLLQARVETIGTEELANMVSRPWLRHLWWEGCLAYILWDVIAVLEKRDLYGLAVKALEVLLFGFSVGAAESLHEMKCSLSPLLLSRRARGKALDRLVIDKSHISRQQNQAKDKALRKQASSDLAGKVALFCEHVLGHVVHSSQITFSAIRAIARRLKRPLSQTLAQMISPEVQQLGLRLANDASRQNDAKDGSDKIKYSDWTPTTDRTVGNALATSMEQVGGRCTFIGHEGSSLNVEELAMECYHMGHLPIVEEGQINEPQGGWVGWHDEGGHLRALFRILCSAPLLGVDWGCGLQDQEVASNDVDTIHLSPYQGAPFDLHVGFGLDATVREPGEPTAFLGFYSRKMQRIDKFLTVLSETSREELCDAVYDAVWSRLVYALDSGHKDPALERDVRNLRTLSMIASGCGGKHLASIFRCIFFDYRHYSGGLPDLLLVRATVQGADGRPRLVNLSDWIGESFSVEYQAEQATMRALSVIADEEFLGCSKVGDARTSKSVWKRNNYNNKSPRNDSSSPSKTTLSMSDLPERLQLIHGGLPVQPECMMVEVKSANDRLDGRQEDWLNILEQHGNARVCQFEDTRKCSNNKKKYSAGESTNYDK